MKVIVKILSTSLIVFTLSIIFLVVYVGNSWKAFTSEEKVLKLTREIKDAEKLPDLFYDLYNVDNLNSLDYNHKWLFVRGILTDNWSRPPSLFVSKYIGQLIRENKQAVKQRRDFKLYEYSLAWKIEEYTSQKECLNWIARNFEFLHGNIGMKNASMFYFKKSLHELNIREMASLIIMIRNPSLYNPLRRKELVNSEASILINRLKENKKDFKKVLWPTNK